MTRLIFCTLLQVFYFYFIFKIRYFLLSSIIFQLYIIQIIIKCLIIKNKNYEGYIIKFNQYQKKRSNIINNTIINSLYISFKFIKNKNKEFNIIYLFNIILFII